MSVTGLTIDTPPEKASRRVRFSLPEAKLTFNNDKRTLHGTSKYVNGTLINVTSTIHSASDHVKSKNEINGVFKSNLKSNNIPTKETSQYKVSLNVRPTSVATIREHGRNSLPATSAGIVGRRNQSKTIVRGSDRSFNTLPIIERKSSSLEDFDEDSLDGDYREETVHELKVKPTNNLSRYKSSEDLRDSNNFKIKSTVLKLPEATNGFAQKKAPTPNTLKVPDYSDTSKFSIIFPFSFKLCNKRCSSSSAIFSKQ